MSAPIRSKIASDAKHKNPPVVRTLKPPPEIWELVHPVDQKQFNPRQTFIRRLGSSATALSLVALVVGLVLGVCVALLRFRTDPRSTAVETIQPAQVGSTSSGNDTANPSNSSAATAIDGSVLPPTTDGSVSDHSRRATSPSIKRKASVAVEARQGGVGSETSTGVEDNLAPPTPRSQTRTTDEQSTVATDSNEKSSSDSASAKPKSNTSLSPQVIAPVKSDSTRKAKVIQWP